jgi:hypothetical protein
MFIARAAAGRRARTTVGSNAPRTSSPPATAKVTEDLIEGSEEGMPEVGARLYRSLQQNLQISNPWANRQDLAILGKDSNL